MRKKLLSVTSTVSTCFLAALYLMATFHGVAVGEDDDENSPPALSGGATPQQAKAEGDVVFTCIYKDADNDPPAGVWVYINGEKHEMGEINPQDTNYTDGKDYMYRCNLGGGTWVYYFEASDGNHTVSTHARTVYIQSSSLLGGEHRDLIMAGSILFLVFVAPWMVFVAWTMKRLEKAIEHLGGKKSSGGEKTERQNL